jgi:cell division septum initiation protein DivIVA
MSNFSNAAEAIGRLAKQHQVYADAAAELVQIGSLMQAASEAEKKIADAKVGLEAIEVETAAFRAEIAAAKDEAKDLIEKSKASAAEIYSAAYAEASKTVASAEAKAQTLLEEAKAAAEELTSREAELAKKFKAEAIEAETATAVAQSGFATAQRELALAQKQLDDIRAKVRNLIG